MVRAGDTSLHPGWGAAEPGCGFDLIVSYFGDDPLAFRAPHENRVDQKGGKWDGIHALFAQRPDLLKRYDHFWLPDDDIETDRWTIEGVFATMRRLNLAVAQPALSLDSYFSHFPLLRSRSFELRFVDMVEIMAPCLSAVTLARALPLLADNMSGFGMDALWTRFAADNHATAAVLDSLPVRHTRPVGTALAKTLAGLGRSSDGDLLKLQQKYSLGTTYPLCYAAIDAGGRHWGSQAAIGMRMAADYMSQRTAFRQTEGFVRDIRRLMQRQLLWSPQLSPLKALSDGNMPAK